MSDTQLADLARKPRISWLVMLGAGLAGVSVLALLAAAMGYRSGVLVLGTAFLVLRWGGYVGGAAAVVSLGALIMTLARPRDARRGVGLAVIGVVLGAFALVWVGSIPSSQNPVLRPLPPIHDITTDTQDPPQFVAVLPLRVNARNPTEYGGEKIAARQREAYPDVQPLTLELSPSQTFERALATVRKMGWDLVDEDAATGRIEATDTTFWFRFKDDVVIRVKMVEGGSRVDVRSLSRIGGGDVGTNAKRIRAYLQELKAG